jgi:hypothetical protein
MGAVAAVADEDEGAVCEPAQPASGRGGGPSPRVRGPILWVADRQFGYTEVLAGLSSATDRFLVRYHGNVCFTPDPGRASRIGTDAQGRSYSEEWGWLGGTQNRHRRYIRRIILDLGTERLVLVTDLLDAGRFPAEGS